MLTAPEVASWVTKPETSVPVAKLDRPQTHRAAI